MKIIKLRKLKMTDLNRLMEIFTNDNVVRNLAFPEKGSDITIEMEENWLKKQIKNYEKEKAVPFNLAIIADGKHVGNIGVHHLYEKENWVEFGYWVGEKYWGKGIMTKAIELFSDLIYKKYNMFPMAEPFVHNLASQKVLEKNGFKFFEIRKEAFEKYGKKFDTKIYVKNYD